MSTARLKSARRTEPGRAFDSRQVHMKQITICTPCAYGNRERCKCSCAGCMYAIYGKGMFADGPPPHNCGE